MAEEEAENRRMKSEAALEEVIDIDELSEMEKEAQIEATTCSDSNSSSEDDTTDDDDETDNREPVEEERGLTDAEEDAMVEDERLGII